MHRFAVIALIASLVFTQAPAFADSPMPTLEGKQFGAGVSGAAFDLYEKTSASVTTLQLDWQQAQPKNPGSSASSYDFAAFDGNPLLKSAKPKILRIGLANDWANKLKQTDFKRYLELAEAFVFSTAKHASERGIKVFSLSADEPDAKGRPDWARAYATELSSLVPALRRAVQNATVIAGGISNGDDATVQAFYDGGAASLFDVLDIHASTDDKLAGVDIFQVVSAHNAMARNGDGSKLIFVGAGWGPKSGEASAETRREFLDNGFRNLVTDRDIYDPNWLHGATFSTFDEKIAEDFLPKLPEHRFEASLSAAGPAFTYIVGKPYKLELKITNLTASEMQLGRFAVRIRGAASVKAEPAGETPKAVAPGNSAVAVFDVTLPESAANRQITLIGELSYSIKDKSHYTDCWLTLIPTPELEITMLPSRAILDGREESSRIGLSVINHSDTPFDGKITLTPSPRLGVKPASLDMKIDSYGLEATVFTVTPEPKAAPGHYAVWVDVGGKVKDWVAVDLPVFVKQIDKPDPWAGGSQVTIARYTPDSDGKDAYETVGKASFSHDRTNLYIAVEIDDDKHIQKKSFSEITTQDSLQIGIDPLLDGARLSSGGYMPDDWELAFATQDNGGTTIDAIQAPKGKRVEPGDRPSLVFDRQGAKSIYKVTLPWSLLGLTPAKGLTFAVGIAVNDYDGDGVKTTEWGGGIAAKKDPRLFVPVVIQ